MGDSLLGTEVNKQNAIFIIPLFYLVIFHDVTILQILQDERLTLWPYRLSVLVVIKTFSDLPSTLQCCLLHAELQEK